MNVELRYHFFCILTIFDHLWCKIEVQVTKNVGTVQPCTIKKENVMRKCIMCRRELEDSEFNKPSSFACTECEKSRSLNRMCNRVNRNAYIKKVQRGEVCCAICGQSTHAPLYFLSTKPVKKLNWKRVENTPVVHLDCLINIQPKRK